MKDSPSAEPLRATPHAKRRVLVIDDHPIVRQGLALLIEREADLTVCGQAEDAHEALDVIASLQPDIVLLDISLGGQDGLEVLKKIRARDPDLPVLVLSMHDELIYAERALRAGADGYIMKQEATDRVLTAIRRIIDGQMYVPDRVATRMLKQYARGAHPDAVSPVASLSDRELEVFRLIGHGSSTREIAEVLHLSIKTVESYQAHIKEKLALRNARELHQHAIEWAIAAKSE
jgi:DNA-binding NarL/FixJ family response regulator